jgi:8-hydroxy-5-deazaflavin:NADPH oxidoreductase
MRIGILGAGGMADALGTQWAAAGHEVMVSGRDAGRTAALAEKMTEKRAAGGGVVRAGTFAEVAGFGEVVVVAVREEGLPGTLRAAGAALRGKPLVDVTNVPFTRYDLAHSPARLIGEVSGGHVVKAFNLCHVDVWRMTPPAFGGRPLAVPVCGDDPEARAAAYTLVTDLGCTPVDGGGLERAALLEATAAFVIGLWFGGADAQAILPPLPSSGTHGH